MLAAFFKLF